MRWLLVSLCCIVAAWLGYSAGWRKASATPELDEAFTVFQARPSLLGQDSAKPSETLSPETALRETLPDALLAMRDRDHDTFLSRLRQLETLSADQLESLLGDLDPNAPKFGMLFDLLVRADPQRAFALTETLSDGRGTALMVMALNRWSAVDPRAAWSALQAMEGTRRPGYLEEQVLGQWAKSDLDGALEAWAALPEGVQSASFGRIADAHIRDPESRTKLLEFLTEQPESKGRSWGFSNVLQSWAKDAPLSEVVAWIDGRGDLYHSDDIARFERQVAGVAVQRDAEEAIGWLLARSGPERRSEDLEALVRLWAVSEPNAAGRWLGTLTPEPETDAAVATFARAIRKEDPESALEWASQIRDDSLRAATSETVIEAWREVDPATAPSSAAGGG